jgi:hypothetical protein
MSTETETETENPELRQEDDQVSHLQVILGILVVLAVTAVMVVWAWVTTNQGLAERRPSRDFPEQRLGPRRNVEGIGESIFNERVRGETTDVPGLQKRSIEGYRWLDRDRRIVTLPIEQAMDRIAEENAR